MNPVITGYKEVNTLNASNQVVRGVQITWMVGRYGPFTLTTTWEQVQNGTAIADINQKAALLKSLPLATS